MAGCHACNPMWSATKPIGSAATPNRLKLMLLMDCTRPWYSCSVSIIVSELFSDWNALFQSQSRFKSDTTLYVFLTPRVQRDPKFGDASLFSKSAMQAAGIDSTVPAMKPVLVDFIEITQTPDGPAVTSHPIPADRPAETPAQEKPGA